MRFVTAEVKRDTNHSHSADYAPWEIPILQFIHEEGNVLVTGETVVADRELPDPTDEMARLVTRYGKSEGGKTPIVLEVYGAGQAGFAALTAAIEKERVNSRETAGADPLAA